jgi:hypothetical protein
MTLYQSHLFALCEVDEHARELRAMAEEARLARRVRPPHRLRRQVGKLLITAGQALAGQPVDATTSDAVSSS